MIRAGIFLACFLLTACGNPLSKGADGSTVDPTFHPGAPAPANALPARDPEPKVGSATGTKLGPGAVRAAGADTAIQAVILPDHHLMTGSRISGRFSLSRFEPR